MDAFDADVIIYAIIPEHPLGERVQQLFVRTINASVDGMAGVGSTALLPEILTKIRRVEDETEFVALDSYLGCLDLRTVDQMTASLAVELGAKYGLKTVDAIHLATAVNAGADRFITNNSRDFGRHIEEIRVTYPDDLPVPG